MGVPFEIAGLSQFVSELPEGSVVTIEGGIEAPKAAMAKVIARSAKEQGRPSVYFSYGKACGHMEKLTDWEEVRSSFDRVLEGDIDALVKTSFPPSALVIIDSLTYVLMGEDLLHVRKAVEHLRRCVREDRLVMVQFLDDELLERPAEVLMLHHSDGVIQFYSREGPDGITHFIRIPRWMTGDSIERNIYYSLNENHINVDLRYRVV